MGGDGRNDAEPVLPVLTAQAGRATINPTHEAARGKELFLQMLTAMRVRRHRPRHALLVEMQLGITFPEGSLGTVLKFGSPCDPGNPTSRK